MIYVIFFLVGTTASVIGAISGIGGGVIIKPLLDAFSKFDSTVIGLISAFSVLTMSVTSVIRHAVKRTPFDGKATVFLGIGAVLGGIAGDFLFGLIKSAGDDSVVKLAQCSALILLLCFVLIYMNVIRKKSQSSLHVTNFALTILIGMTLGIISTFIGIGGGPINIAVLCLFFGMDIKSATINSLVLIIFSQSAKILKTAVAGTFAVINMPWGIVACMAIGAVLGGLLGTYINLKIDGKKILWVYNGTLLFIIAINIYTIVNSIVAMTV